MPNFSIKNISFFKIKSNKGITKVLITLGILFLFRLGSSLPLEGVDQEALKQSLLQFESNNPLSQLLTMYSGGGVTLLSPFSLGIIPYINAAIVIDLLTAFFPFLEKLQSEEGERGRQKLLFYKKFTSFIFALLQTIFIISYLRPYLYEKTWYSFFLLGSELISGSFVVIWLSSLLDKKGIGNGTSLFIFTNILVSFFQKFPIRNSQFSLSFCFEVIIFFFLIWLICLSQLLRIKIEIVSARQLSYLENADLSGNSETISSQFLESENGLSIRFNQAGIFPLIIASNIFPFFSLFFQSLGLNFSWFSSIFYCFLIVICNYFYTLIFWDPEKIAQQLRKASVSLLHITPGQDTVAYLEKVVLGSSILGGSFLCFIFYLSEYFKDLLGKSFLNEINISSLIILVGVAFEIQKNMRVFSQESNLIQSKNFSN